MLESLGRLLSTLVPILVVYIITALLIGKPKGHADLWFLHTLVWIVLAMLVCILCFQSGLRG